MIMMFSKWFVKFFTFPGDPLPLFLAVAYEQACHIHHTTYWWRSGWHLVAEWWWHPSPRAWRSGRGRSAEGCEAAARVTNGHSEPRLYNSNDENSTKSVKIEFIDTWLKFIKIYDLHGLGLARGYRSKRTIDQNGPSDDDQNGPSTKTAHL